MGMRLRSEGDDCARKMEKANTASTSEQQAREHQWKEDWDMFEAKKAAKGDGNRGQNLADFAFPWTPKVRHASTGCMITCLRGGMVKPRRANGIYPSAVWSAVFRFLLALGPQILINATPKTLGVQSNPSEASH